jgi:hypothetical protein
MIYISSFIKIGQDIKARTSAIHSHTDLHTARQYLKPKLIFQNKASKVKIVIFLIFSKELIWILERKDVVWTELFWPSTRASRGLLQANNELFLQRTAELAASQGLSIIF